MTEHTFEDGSTMRVAYWRRNSEGRQVWEWTIRDAGGTTLADGKDLYSGCCSQATPAEMTETLASFLSAWLEALDYGKDSENYDLFPAKLAEWAQANQDEIEMLSLGDPETW